MFELHNAVMPYDWGSTTAIAALRGAAPSAEPQAELWMGAHPKAPSLVRLPGSETSLLAWIEAQPEAALGEGALEAYPRALPFLFKVLAAERPLSLQAHPNRAQAEAGHAREEAAGIPRDALHRNYRDRHPKPELVCALSAFDALCGFRAPGELAELLAALPSGAARAWAEDLSAPDGLRRAFARVMRAAPAWVGDIVRACRAAAHRSDATGEAARLVLELAQRYPTDVGVPASLMLHRVHLAPGEALFLPAGQLHAYLRGTAVEVMAASDNVLRGGLTSKHMDLEALFEVLAFAPRRPPILVPRPRDAIEKVYREGDRPLALEFELSVLALEGAPHRVRVRGPEIVLALGGELRLEAAEGAPLRLASGSSAFVPAATGSYQLQGSATAYRVQVGAVAEP